MILTRNGTKVDATDNKGQTALYLAAREGSLRSAKLLLLNFANRNAADNMDQSPIQVAREKGHHDIVELISDWTIGAGSPPKAPGSASPESQKSPNIHMHGHPTPPRCTTSPPNMIRPKMNNIAPKMSHIPRSQTQANQQSCAVAVNDNHLNGDPRKTANKRKRKSCNKNAQQPVRAKMNTFALNNKQLNINTYATAGVPISQSVTMAPTLSPPRAEVPPVRLGKEPTARTSDNSYKGTLPVLSDKDIIEGFSLFETQGCFEDLPSNWVNGENAVSMPSQSYNPTVTDMNIEHNPLYVSAAQPVTAIGPSDVNMHFNSSRVNCGATPKIPHSTEGMNNARAPQYHQLVVSAEEMDSLNSLSYAHNIQMNLPNEFHYRSINDKHLQEQLQREGIQSVMQHQFPTPPSVHSGNYMSSPGKSISPQDPAATAASFLTPSPDSPKRSPGGWSTSPQSSESSVC
eukprot:gene15632-17210_t